jgi:hypothetical protein
MPEYEGRPRRQQALTKRDWNYVVSTSTCRKLEEARRVLP